MNDFDKTKVFVPMGDDEKNENQNKRHKKTNNKRSPNKKRKFKLIYLVPISILICGLVFAFYLWSATRNKGPVYGDRCKGTVEVAKSKVNSVVSKSTSENTSISKLEIIVKCRQVKINLEVASDVSIADAEALATDILLSLDKELGYPLEKEEDTYSTLFGYIDGKSQYHVDFVITSKDSEAAGFPCFGSKHPKQQSISFTRNETKDPDLVDELYKDQSGSDEDVPEESSEVPEE